MEENLGVKIEMGFRKQSGGGEYGVFVNNLSICGKRWDEERQ